MPCGISSVSQFFEFNMEASPSNQSSRMMSAAAIPKDLALGMRQQPDLPNPRHSLLQSMIQIRQSVLIMSDFQVDRHDSSSSRPQEAPSYSSLTKTLPEAPYHVLEKRQKELLVYLISMAGLFSPLSSNISLPALDVIANV
jgi:hypothetical protein